VIPLNLPRLEEAAELGRALIAGVPGSGMLILDPQLRVLLAEGDVYRHRDVSHIVGRRLRDLVPASSWEVLEPRYFAAAEGRAQAFEFDAVIDGSAHSMRLAPIRGGATVIGIFVLSQDITLKATAAAQETDSERLQQSVLEVLDEGVLVLDRAGGLVQANRTAGAILGIDLTAARADPSWWQAVAARRTDDDATLSVGATVLRTGKGVRDVAVEAARPDGAAISLSVNYQPLRDAAGAVSGLAISFRDVTVQEGERRRLVTSQERLREAHEVARLATWEWRPDTGEVLLFHALDDVDVQEGTVWSADGLLAAMAPEERAAAREELMSIARGERDTGVMRHPYPDADTWLETRWRVVRDADGTLVCVRGTSQDVSEQELAKQQVTTQAALLEEVDVSVVATDPVGRITHFNRGAERLYGWSQDEAVGRDAAEFLDLADTDAAAEALAELSRTGHWEGEYTVCHKDGSRFPAYLRARVMLDAGARPTGWIGVSVDLTKRLESERALRAASNYLQAVADSLGDGLFTLDTEGRVSYVNEAAEQLLGWSREELLGRVMHEIAHTGRADGSQPGREDWPILNARSDGPGRHVDDVFIRRNGAELPVAYTAAPFETDDGVQGCVVVFEDISERKAHEESLEREAEKLSWIGRIQEALAEDRFELFAQPIVDVLSGEVVQNELLLRLREHDGAIVAAGAFLQIAEDYGLIGEIDRWVIGRAAEIAAAGRPVEVNLSAHSVGDRAILDHIERCIEDRGLDPKVLVFEITETALIKDEAAALAFAERLHELGCKLALDDFGTGYSGFTYLKQLPLDYLKIDIEFVRDLAANPASSHVVKAVVALARGFNLKTVAEGVEDAETLALLAELGVDLAQGYHIARPGPIADIDALR